MHNLLAGFCEQSHTQFAAGGCTALPTAAHYGRFLPRLGPFGRSNGLFLRPKFVPRLRHSNPLKSHNCHSRSAFFAVVFFAMQRVLLQRDMDMSACSFRAFPRTLELASLVLGVSSLDLGRSRERPVFLFARADTRSARRPARAEINCQPPVARFHN